ncbi:YhgE/Pip family protein [Mumia sp. Pv 4-285]|uniref:YhgE/Pip family protein n=1 Tax=Mumia qirimensis TaxID=3234852 RepID=UPI00351D6812
MDDNASGADDVRRRGRRRAVVVGVVLPLISAAVVIWSVTDREERLDTIPVAIVNNDTIITEPQPMAAGRALTASLTDPSTSAPNLDWTLTDAADAAAGLRDGDYYAVLTIPEDFSRAILSSGTASPAQGQLTLTSNAAASTTVPYLSAQIAGAAATSLGNQTTQGYLKNVYDGFNQIASSNEKAASSAAQLADGTAELATGAGSLDDGVDSLAAGLERLAGGADGLSAATDGLVVGADEVATGARGVATGSGELGTAASELARSSRSLSTASAALSTASGVVSKGASGLAKGDARLAVRAKTLAEDLRAIRRDCRAEGGSARFCVRLDGVRDSAIVLAGGTALSERAAKRLAGATAASAQGAKELAGWNAKLARGAGALDRAEATLSAGARGVAVGAETLAVGTGEVATAAGTLASATDETVADTAALVEGAATLDSSAEQVDSGAQSLSSGLAKGAAESPTYTTAQQDTLATVVSEPVVLDSSVEHDDHGNGWLLAAVLGAVLWLSAMVSAMGVQRERIRALAMMPVSSRRMAWSFTLPVLGLAVLQAAAVMAAVLLFSPSVDALVPLATLSLLAAVTFSLVAVGLRLAFGGAGVAAYVVLLVVQLAALAVVVPLETAPGLLRTLNGLMPLSAFTNGAAQLVAGGAVTSMVGVVAVLLMWALGAVALAVAAVKRRRRLPLG